MYHVYRQTQCSHSFTDIISTHLCVFHTCGIAVNTSCLPVLISDTDLVMVHLAIMLFYLLFQGIFRVDFVEVYKQTLMNYKSLLMTLT